MANITYSNEFDANAWAETTPGGSTRVRVKLNAVGKATDGRGSRRHSMDTVVPVFDLTLTPEAFEELVFGRYGIMSLVRYAVIEHGLEGVAEEEN